MTLGPEWPLTATLLANLVAGASCLLDSSPTEKVGGWRAAGPTVAWGPPSQALSGPLISTPCESRALSKPLAPS